MTVQCHTRTVIWFLCLPQDTSLIYERCIFINSRPQCLPKDNRHTKISLTEFLHIRKEWEIEMELKSCQRETLDHVFWLSYWLGNLCRVQSSSIHIYGKLFSGVEARTRKNISAPPTTMRRGSYVCREKEKKKKFQPTYCVDTNKGPVNSNTPWLYSSTRYSK